jgi:ParB family chromosome partitioning protein
VTTEVKELKEETSQTAPKAGLQTLPVDVICRGKYQPRRVMEPEALQELADSIKAQGIIQPIVVRPINEEKYEIIAGERRWRAAQIAGMDEVPVVIKKVSDEATIAMSLIENIQRQDLNAIEEALALQRLIDEFEMTHQAVAEAVGKSRASVSNFLRLLSLNEDVKQLLSEHKIEMGHAKVLLGADKDQQSQLARIVALKGLSVRETEVLVRRGQVAEGDAPARKRKDPSIRQLEKDLSLKLRAKVKLLHKEGGKGKITIPYANLEELEKILEHIS